MRNLTIFLNRIISISFPFKHRKKNFYNMKVSNVPQIALDSTYEPEESEHDKEMQAKLADFMVDSNLDDDDEEDVETEAKKRQLNVPDALPENCLDHVMLATCDLKEGMERFEKMTGLKPTKIGSLRGVGTKSARVSLSNGTFVEIIGPDEKASSEGMGPHLLNMPEGKLVPFHYSVRAKPDDVEIPESLNWDKDDVVMVYADADDFAEDGEVCKWDLVFLYGHGLGGIVPSFVNWREIRHHPTARLEKTGAKLVSVRVQAPSGNYAHDLLGGVKGITMCQGQPELSFSIDTPKGVVSFSGSKPMGIVMPGFGDDNHPSMNRRM
jgi:hypothetical protein